MEFLKIIISFFLHIDKHLGAVIAAYGGLTYGILFLIILCETGLVVTPFLPGDSLLFAAGAFAGRGDLNILVLCGILFFAAVGGDALNFFIGARFGTWILAKNSRIIRHEHLEKTHRFFERYGGKTIIIARFMPIVRTLAPFVAGVGKMSYGHFMTYNIVGAAIWVLLFTVGGYFFGSLPFVEKNFSIVILFIIVLSVLPGFFEWIRSRKGQ